MHNSCECKIYLWINEKYHMISKIRHKFWSYLFYDLLKERSTDDVTSKTVLLPYIEQINSILPWLCFVLDHRKLKMNYENPRHTSAPLCLLSGLTSFLSHIWSITEQKYRSIDTVFLKKEYRNTYDIYLWSFCFSSYNN